MKIAIRLLLGLLVIVAVACVIALFLPKTVFVARSTSISAPGDVVFSYVNNLKKFQEWSPWAPRDPATRYQYSGPDEGVGATMSWQSNRPDVGSGTMEIVESKPHEFVKLSLNFGDQGTGIAHHTLSPSDEGTNIIWAFETDLGYNPIARYMGLMFDDWIGPDYEAGLARLKALVESDANN
ncbi:MAG: SRPBCC family protein [Fimbriimonadaceae bacterium]|nr:SRPBCC family protein [Alphaproteobacteria bacterium]